jgi:hypothetical protein
MRRLSASRAWAAVAVVAAIVAVLAVMVFSGVGIGAPTISHGGSPTEVVMNTVPETCTQVDREGGHLMQTPVDFDQRSHLLVYFTSEWTAGETPVDLRLGFAVVGVDETFFTPVWELGKASKVPASGTVMYTLEDVPAGDYTVQVFAQTHDTRPATVTHAVLNHCALTVFVTPVAV